MKDFSKAEEMMKIALGISPEDEGILFNLAVVYEKVKKFDEMFSYLQKTLEVNPDHVDALNYLGYSYADRGINLDKALDLVKKAVELAPASGYIRDSLGWVYFKKGLFNEALKEILKASEIEKDDPVIFEHLGDVYKNMDNKEAAIKAWEKSLEFHEKEEGLKERIEEKIENLK